MAEPKNVMEQSALKALLLQSRQEPLPAAIGLGADGGGKLLVHKTKGPMALAKEIEASSPGLKDLRFGHARVDADENAQLVKIVINRAVTGLSRHLVKTLKGTGFTKVQLLLEDGSVVDGADDPAEQPAVTAEPPPPPPPPPSQAPRPTTQATPDAASLANLLKALVEPMRAAIAAAPDRRDSLMALAATAQADLKSGNLAGAMAAIRALRDSVATVPSSGTTTAATAAAGTGVAFQKLRLLWDGTRKHLMDQLKLLEAKVIEASAAAPNAPEIQANVARLEVSLQTLDTRLSDALDALYNAGGQDAKLKAAARRIAQSYQGFLATDPLMQELDGNPFIKLDARARLDTTLAAVIGHL